MKHKANKTVYAFIDSQNLNLGIQSLGWKLDFGKFYVYLHQQFRVRKAYLFIGYVPSNQRLYSFLEKIGYDLVFKPTIRAKGQIKGNVDLELGIQAMHDLCASNFDQAVIVTGDGDFRILVEYLKEKHALKGLIIPNMHSYSSLLRQFLGEATFLNNSKKKLSRK